MPSCTRFSSASKPVADSPAGIAARIERNWYRPVRHNLWLLLLWPLVALSVWLKRWRFLHHPPPANPVPVVVVGNITVGGTGKTPLITWLVERARALGLQPAIVSRGYGGSSRHYPLAVTAETPAAVCGDEPRLLQSRLNCPVVVDPQRRRAVAALAGQADIIFSDDGLQHYAMARDAELAVVDGGRGFGNGWLLPLGPLREPVSRLNSVDLTLVNGRDFHVRPLTLVNAVSGAVLALDQLAGQHVCAVAGIGNPQRFYDTLTVLGAELETHSFADHHRFTASDFDFAQDFAGLLVMTEKDWVKCRAFARTNWWYLQVSAVPEADIQARLDKLLSALVRPAIQQTEGHSHG